MAGGLSAAIAWNIERGQTFHRFIDTGEATRTGRGRIATVVSSTRVKQKAGEEIYILTLWSQTLSIVGWS